MACKCMHTLFNIASVRDRDGDMQSTCNLNDVESVHERMSIIIMMSNQ